MQQANGGFRLIVRRGPQPNQIYELKQDVVTIGRDITNDITINDPEVSRHHARLTREGSGYTIEDLGSTNGTFVNGQRLTGPRPLQPGETVGLGETVTLAYESSAIINAAPPSGNVAPAMPQPAPPPPPSPTPGYQQPVPQQAPQPAPSPYAPPSSGQPAPPAYDSGYYTPEAPPPSPYGAAYVDDRQGGGMARWLLLGCGCFIVLCVIGTVVALIIVDQTCAWQNEPFSSILEIFGQMADPGASACQ